jgi:hypothetical protein
MGLADEVADALIGILRTGKPRVASGSEKSA